MTKIGTRVLKKKVEELKPTKAELEIKIPPGPVDLFTFDRSFVVASPAVIPVDMANHMIVAVMFP